MSDTHACMHAGTFANEDSVYLGPDGVPVDRSGEPILDADGNPTMLDAEGFVVDAAGNKYQPDGSNLPSDDSLPEGPCPPPVLYSQLTSLRVLFCCETKGTRIVCS